MQTKIHPELKKTTVTCACGEVFEIKSTKENIRVEICSKCHPFYTGKKRKSAKGGRVERFNARYGFSEEDEEIEETANKIPETDEKQETEQKTEEK